MVPEAISGSQRVFCSGVPAMPISSAAISALVPREPTPM
jgi:hypothetical protein